MDSRKLEGLCYDMIIVRDLQQILKAVIDFGYEVIKWDDVSIPMNRTKLSKNNRKELYAIFQLATEPKMIQQDSERISFILDILSEKAHLVEVEKNHFCYLWRDTCEVILKLLCLFEDFSHDTLEEFH